MLCDYFKLFSLLIIDGSTIFLADTDIVFSRETSGGAVG
ncbi:hypothetical protein SD1617_0810 [Shigella dysenteriae 1617]|uniref:Uncharacterized protein n=1 Tax=Shigella dysenteriae 1617 TaxID=754093 RepID=E2X4N6_SHIDY|nr:hypothetical protein Asd1617_05350 [Shigella dysenteriae 1617]EFP73331.1 hypothetical protein SD1617_0810 [Shigella dysenteriae 1617]